MAKVIFKGFGLVSMLPGPISPEFLMHERARKYEVEMSDEEIEDWKKALGQRIKDQKISDKFCKFMIVFPSSDIFFVDDFGVVKHGKSSYYIMPNVFLALYIFLQEKLDVKKSTIGL